MKDKEIIAYLEDCGIVPDDAVSLCEIVSRDMQVELTLERARDIFNELNEI